MRAGGALDATESKRRDLRLVIARLLAPEPCVQGVVAVGSVATGHARLGSDIDAIIFMEPLDLYVVPAESIWCPWDDSFHSIFVNDQRIQDDGLQLDFNLVDLKQWSSESFVWSEAQRAGLDAGWLAFDRHGVVQRLIAERTAYDDATRISKLDGAVCALAQHLGETTPEDNWDRYGAPLSFGRLASAYDALVDALFAFNRRWRFFRDRETEHLLRLTWLPADFEHRMPLALNAPSVDRGGLDTRVRILRQMFEELLAKLQQDGYYGANPAGQAFVRSHDEPGRAWNMDDWRRRHERRR